MVTNEDEKYFAYTPASRKRSKNYGLLKILMLGVAENIGRHKRIEIWNDYETPLSLATKMDDADSILALCKRGADVNRVDSSQRTPLHRAVEFGNLNACGALLESNANIDAIDYFGRTPLMHLFHATGDALTWPTAKRIEENEKIVELLVRRGANRALTDCDGKTAERLAHNDTHFVFKSNKRCIGILQTNLR